LNDLDEGGQHDLMAGHGPDLPARGQDNAQQKRQSDALPSFSSACLAVPQDSQFVRGAVVDDIPGGIGNGIVTAIAPMRQTPHSPLLAIWWAEKLSEIGQ
jgi:hypothetical protein